MHALDETAPGARRIVSVDNVAMGLLALAGLAYLARAVALASTTPLAMDEVLAVWTASQPSVAGVWRALVQGAEFSPPGFDLLLHGLRDLGLTSPLAMRAPSIIALPIAAAGVFVLVRRHAPVAIAAVACAAVLSGGAFVYAVQARPYACSTAAIAWAVVLWEGRARDETHGATLGIGGLCALAIAFHFYAAILVGLLGLAELSSTAIGRRPRFDVLGAIALGGASVLLWWPIAHAAAAWNGADAFARDFYARPTGSRLLMTYASFVIPLVPAFLVASAARVLLARGGRSATRDGRVTMLIGVAACAVPVVVFAFALAVTHAFSARYVVVAALGLAVVLGRMLRPLGERGGPIALGVLALLAVSSPPAGDGAAQARIRALDLAAGAPEGLPIVTGDGLRFLEITGNDRLADRLVYLRVPDPEGGGDPTNRHQVERWAAMKPSLLIQDAASFVCATPRFVMIHDVDGGRDDLPDWLSRVADIRWMGADKTGRALVEPRPCLKARDDDDRVHEHGSR